MQLIAELIEGKRVLSCHNPKDSGKNEPDVNQQSAKYGARVDGNHRPDLCCAAKLDNVSDDQ